MQQLKIKTESEKIPTSCAFTGHRELDKEFSPLKLLTEMEAYKTPCISHQLRLVKLHMLKNLNKL